MCVICRCYCVVEVLIWRSVTEGMTVVLLLREIAVSPWMVLNVFSMVDFIYVVGQTLVGLRVDRPSERERRES